MFTMLLTGYSEVSFSPNPAFAFERVLRTTVTRHFSVRNLDDAMHFIT